MLILVKKLFMFGFIINLVVIVVDIYFSIFGCVFNVVIFVIKVVIVGIIYVLLILFKICDMNNNLIVFFILNNNFDRLKINNFIIIMILWLNLLVVFFVNGEIINCVRVNIVVK